MTEEKPKKGEEEEVDATVKSYRDIHSVLADSKFYLVANLKAFLDAHLTSDRYSLLEKKKKLEEQLYVVRDANGEVSGLRSTHMLYFLSAIFLICVCVLFASSTDGSMTSLQETENLYLFAALPKHSKTVMRRR